MQTKTKVKYNSFGRPKEATLVAQNDSGSTSATYSYNQQGVAKLTKTEQKKK